MTYPPNQLLLDAFDGSNPLAFLATLGILRAAGNGAKIHWQRDLKPVLTLPDPIDRALFYTEIARQLRSAKLVLDEYPEPSGVGEVVKTNARSFRKFAQADANGENKIAFAACFASEAVRDQSDYDLVAPTRLSLANGNGGKKLLLHFRQMLQAASTDTRAVDLKAKKKPSQTLPTIEQLIEEATSEWKRRDGKVYYSFRWDPAELRRAAFMATSPADDSFSPVPGANLLAVLGLTFLPSMPTAHGLQTTCLFPWKNQELFAWPLWNAHLSADEVLSLLVNPGDNENKSFAPEWRESRGIFARFAVERYSDAQKNAYFNSSFGI